MKITRCITRPAEGVAHIRDEMGVCYTLLRGAQGAVLVDAGYGLRDVRRSLPHAEETTPRVILTHGHHDHALGAMHFERVWLHPADAEVYREYTSAARRERVLAQAAERGVAPGPRAQKRFLTRPMPQTCDITGDEIDLGGLTVRVIPCPGHTPGSLVLFVPERRLLLTGDDYNPCTWLFFHEALGPRSWRENLRALLALPFDRVLCPHAHEAQPRARLEAFLDAVTDDALRNAKPSPEGDGVGVETRRVETADGQVFVFSWEKFLMGL